MIEVRAPAVIKLLGEHAVVYGRLGIAVAIDMYAKTAVSEHDGNGLIIDLSDIGVRERVTADDLNRVYRDYRSKSIDEFRSSDRSVSDQILPYLTIASRVSVEYGKSLDGIQICISSEIPLQRGFASSGACSTSFATALVSALGLELGDGDIIDIARDGDRVIHMNRNAGTLDVNTSYYGGFVSYRGSTGVRMEEVGIPIRLVLIDTGPKRSTAETVGHIASLYNTDRDSTEALLNGIEECSVDGMRCLKSGDIDGLGRDMLIDHRILSRLGVSSDALDRAVDICMRNGALGAKLSGGGGGGVAIALTRDSGRLIDQLRAEGFEVMERDVTRIGAKHSIKKGI